MSFESDIVYLTFNDSPSGIFKSQVIDRVNFLNSTGQKTQLIAFLPNPNFKKNKQTIQDWSPKAIVLKQIPGLRFWFLNSIKLIPFILNLKPKKVIGRSIYATNLALILKKINLTKAVVYDGRGAVTAECEEFNMVPKHWLPGIKHLEWKAINLSDFQLAVSNALITYWKGEFDYAKSTYRVIPCTVGEHFLNIEISDEKIKEARKNLGFSQNDIIISYSGSLASWQFKEGLELDLTKWLELSNTHKLLFLCKPHKKVDFLLEQFPNQVVQQFVKPEKVPQNLIAADFGLLVRDELITNRVASPVKFAEYLACGLKVIISENIGDYSDLVKGQKMGLIFDNSFPRESNFYECRLSLINYASNQLSINTSTFKFEFENSITT